MNCQRLFDRISRGFQRSERFAQASDTPRCLDGKPRYEKPSVSRLEFIHYARLLGSSRMFISHEFYLEGRVGFPGSGRTAWRMVERESMDPWYHVTLRFTEGVRQLTKRFMPTDASFLSDLLELEGPTCLVEEVQVITSPWVNGSSSERMEKLISLVIGYDQNRQCVLLHKVASGAVYSSAPDSLDISSLTDTRTIYEDAKSAHTPVQECAEH